MAEVELYTGNELVHTVVRKFAEYGKRSPVSASIKEGVKCTNFFRTGKLAYPTKRFVIEVCDLPSYLAWSKQMAPITSNPVYFKTKKVFSYRNLLVEEGLDVKLYVIKGHTGFKAIAESMAEENFLTHRAVPARLDELDYCRQARRLRAKLWNRQSTSLG